MVLLLVEDHDDTRRAMEMLLRLSGHQVTSVASGAEALTAASANRFDCAIVDLGLPDTPGTDLFPKLTGLAPMAGIALTGSTSPSDVDRCRAAGFTLHLAKPVGFDSLEAALAAVAAGR
jgi:CheY-like chemotaxis protein